MRYVVTMRRRRRVIITITGSDGNNGHRVRSASLRAIRRSTRRQRRRQHITAQAAATGRDGTGQDGPSSAVRFGDEFFAPLSPTRFGLKHRLQGLRMRTSDRPPGRRRALHYEANSFRGCTAPGLRSFSLSSSPPTSPRLS